MKFQTEKKSTLCIYTEVDYDTEKVKPHVFIIWDLYVSHNITQRFYCSGNGCCCLTVTRIPRED